MVFTTQLLAAAVLATSEFCAEPFDGGVEDPQFCRVTAPLEISTPYFSISIEPNFLVGIDRQGRRLRVQSTLWQNQDYLLIQVDVEAVTSHLAGCAKIETWVEDDVSWQDCRMTTEGMYERRLMASMAGRHVRIEYGYSSLGTVSAPALERMTQSIRVLRSDDALDWPARPAQRGL
jgi:hypothetical protein